MKFIPKKSLGQNFLVNKGVLQRIVNTLDLSPKDTVLEVGPGKGALTELLAQAGAQVIAIEKDSRLISSLREKFYNNKKVEIIEGDILKFKIQNSLASPRRSHGRAKFKIRDYKVVGNLPYYITSHFLRILLEDWPPFEHAVFMVQKEVAQRICAGAYPKTPYSAAIREYRLRHPTAQTQHSNKYASSSAKTSRSKFSDFATKEDFRTSSKPPKMNLLAISIQLYAEPKIIMQVSRGSFRPVPNVDSAIISLVPHNKFKNSDNKTVIKLAKIGFAQKRKQLLPKIVAYAKISRSTTEKLLEKVGISPTERAENITVEKWIRLSETIKNIYPKT